MTIEYIAGFFDGEGCIDKTYSKTYSGMRLRFTQNTFTVLEEIRDYFGKGHLYSESRDGMFRLELRHKSARDAARKMLPHLIVKEEKVAQLLKEWDDSHPNRP